VLHDLVVHKRKRVFIHYTHALKRSHCRAQPMRGQDALQLGFHHSPVVVQIGRFTVASGEILWTGLFFLF
jgi:hypothetical protein